MRKRTIRLAVTVVLLGTCARAELPELDYNPSSAQVLRFISAAARDSAYLTVASIGDSVRGRPIPVVIANDPAVSPLDMTRILILCRQHGNEPAGTVAMLQLIREVAQGSPSLLAELKRVCLLIVPMVNPDGADANQRHNARDADLNRDWIYRRQPETRAVEYLFGLWNPQVVLDLHELHWRDAHGLNTVEAPEPTIAVTGGDEARDLQALILNRLITAGFPVRVSSWDGSNNMNLCHRHYARDHGRVALLFESERQGLRTPLPRRAEMHRLGVQVVIDYYYAGERERNWPRLAFAPVAPGPVVADAGGDNAAGSLTAKRPPATPAKVEVIGLDADAALSGEVPLRIEIGGVADLNYVAARLDGQGRYFSNQTRFQFTLHCDELAAGTHALLVTAYRRDGSVVEREYTFTVAGE